MDLLLDHYSTIGVSLPPHMRGWRNTVETVLFEVSNSMKPYPSVFHACTSQLRPVTVSCSSQTISMMLPIVFSQPLNMEGSPTNSRPGQHKESTRRTDNTKHRRLKLSGKPASPPCHRYYTSYLCIREISTDIISLAHNLTSIKQNIIAIILNSY